MRHHFCDAALRLSRAGRGGACDQHPQEQHSARLTLSGLVVHKHPSGAGNEKWSQPLIDTRRSTSGYVAGHLSSYPTTSERLRCIYPLQLLAGGDVAGRSCRLHKKGQLRHCWEVKRAA